MKRYLEIGARHGDTFYDVMRSLPLGSVGVAVDLPGGLWGTSASKRHMERAVKELNRQGYSCTCLFGNSQTMATRQLIMGRGPYDAILIDGDHTLPGVSMDWAQYGKMAPLVAFHDIVGTGESENVHGNLVEVPILWASLRKLHKNVEFIGKGSTMGIGVICNSSS